MNNFSNKKFGLLPNLPTKINHIKFSSKCRLCVAVMIFFLSSSNFLKQVPAIQQPGQSLCLNIKYWIVVVCMSCLVVLLIYYCVYIACYECYCLLHLILHSRADLLPTSPHIKNDQNNKQSSEKASGGILWFDICENIM